VTALVARSTTAVFAAFRLKVTVTPLGMVSVVKLNTPFGGNGTV
jgi:hypothetical protein